MPLVGSFSVVPLMYGFRRSLRRACFVAAEPIAGAANDAATSLNVSVDTVRRDRWRNFNLDLAILGVCGFDPERGASTRSQNEVATKRALSAAAAETIIPVQNEKLRTQAPFHIMDTTQVDTLIVEKRTPASTINQCRAQGLEVITA